MSNNRPKHVTCSRCGFTAIADFSTYFSLDKKRSTGYQAHCKKCDAARASDRYSTGSSALNTHAVGERRYKRVYGLTFTTAQQLLDAQNHRCKICLEWLEPIPNKHTHVDHSHHTGRVRGILCINCNHAVGKVKDNPLIAKRLTEYLLHHNSIDYPLAG